MTNFTHGVRGAQPPEERTSQRAAGPPRSRVHHKLKGTGHAVCAHTRARAHDTRRHIQTHAVTHVPCTGFPTPFYTLEYLFPRLPEVVFFKLCVVKSISQALMGNFSLKNGAYE